MMRRPGAPRWCGRMLARLRAGGDREYEMLANRLVIGAAAVVYSFAAIGSGVAARRELQVIAALFLAGAAALTAHALARPGASRARRLLGILLDNGALSLAFQMGGAVVTPFFPVYLWIILGNGFRFGLGWLRISAAAGGLGFGLVLLTTPYWSANLHLGVGLLVGLVAIPLYAEVLIRRLSAAKQQAEAANVAKSLFLARVSHELRTPLNAVIGMGSLIAATRLNDEQREMSDTIVSASSALLALIDDILDLSRAEAGRMPVNVAPFDLNGLLREVAAVFRLRAQEKGLRLALHVSARTPLDVTGDVRHLREVLLNLVGNAVKFTGAGSVTLSVDCPATNRPAPEGADADWADLRFEVADTGIGIAPAAQERVFEDFTQADGTIMNRFGGTGLGLAITRRLVGLMGGTVTLRSAEGKGSTFVVELRLGRTAARPVPQGVQLAMTAYGGAELDGLADRLRGLGFAVAPGAHTGARTGTHPAGALGSITLAGGGPAVLVLAGNPGMIPLDIRQACASAVAEASPDEHLATAVRLLCGHGTSTAAPDGPAALRPRPFHVLVADDNHVNTRVLQMVLRRAGHTVTVVSNGEQALDELEAGRFDAVLMDLNMPVLDGLEATKMFRFCALGEARTPIIGLTADVTDGVQARCLAAGMDACLSKPVEPAELLDALDALVPVGAVPVGAVPAGAEQPRTASGGADQAEADQAGADQAGTGSADGAVTDIAAHPRFRAAGGPAVDQAMLAKLEALGGREFLDDLIADFLADAHRLQEEITTACAAGDGAAVAAHAHALLGAAGNMGAEPLRSACRVLQNAPPSSLARDGGTGLRDLRLELNRAARSLDALRASRSLDAERAAAMSQPATLLSHAGQNGPGGQPLSDAG